MQIKSGEIHVWLADLSFPWENEHKQFVTLSEDEEVRAHQFHFEIHSRRFIVSRSLLRHLLGMYLNTSPGRIELAYTAHKKPFLKTHNPLSLEFNLSHSENKVVYAFTLGHPIGIDIEKIADNFNEGVLERFFTREENSALKQLRVCEQVRGFYRIWSRKEALAKAIGEGLTSVFSLSVSVTDVHESMWVDHKRWSLISLSLCEGYQSALATTQATGNLICRNVLDEHSLWQGIRKANTI